MSKYCISSTCEIDPKGAEQLPHLLYVSSWRQTGSTLPRSLHSHPDFAEFSFVLAGRGICEINGTLYPIEKDDIVIYNPGILHDEFVDSQPISLVSIAADNIHRPGLPENCIIENNITPVFHLYSDTHTFHALLTALADEIKSVNLYRDSTCQALFQALFYKMLSQIDASCPQLTISDQIHTDLAHQIRAYVDRHITEKLSVQTIAHTFHISPSYLARIFKNALGCPLSQYIIRRRLGEAQTLLLNTELPISEVAGSVGYPNQSYFTKLFMQSFHITPLQYRKLLSQQLINLSYPTKELHNGEGSCV